MPHGEQIHPPIRTPIAPFHHTDRVAYPFDQRFPIPSTLAWPDLSLACARTLEIVQRDG